MPWQQQVADVALEIDPNTGVFAYREIWITIPRQSGKTTLILPMAVFRAAAEKHFGGRQKMLYAAQTAKDSRDKWEEDFVLDVKKARALRGKFRVSLAQGREAIKFRTGSSFGPIAVTEKAGHGKTLDVGFLDEAFAQPDDRVEQAWRPAMLTREWAQLYGLSTAGTDESVYLRGKVDAGRRLVESGTDTGIAYFEFSAEDDADPFDPATWWSCMPALGYTVSERTIRAELMALSEAGNLNLFLRAYLNRWVARDAGEQVLPAMRWRDCRDDDSELAGEPAFAVDVAPDSRSAAIGVAGWRADGLQHLEVIDHRPGVEWLVPRVAEVCSRWSSLPVSYDPAGPVRSIVPELQAAGVMVSPVTAGDHAAACEGLFKVVCTGGARHIGQRELDTAVVAGRKRILGDGWAWKRATSAGDISPLVAVTLARWNLLQHPVISDLGVSVV